MPRYQEQQQSYPLNYNQKREHKPGLPWNVNLLITLTFVTAGFAIYEGIHSKVLVAGFLSPSNPPSETLPSLDETQGLSPDIQENVNLEIPNIYSQHDLRWSDRVLGYSPEGSVYTIGNYGCLVSVYAMLLGNKTPLEVNDLMVDGQGFIAGDGNINPKKVESVLGLKQLDVSAFYNGPLDDQGFEFVRKYLSNGYPIVARVDFNINTDTPEEHYVLVTGYDHKSDGSYVYKYADPWEGMVKEASSDQFSRLANQFRVYDH
jgi:hypothetical protein